jgi:hypothetical protein
MPGSLFLCGSAASYTVCQAGGSAATASASPANAVRADRRSSCCHELSGSHAVAGFGRGLKDPEGKEQTACKHKGHDQSAQEKHQLQHSRRIGVQATVLVKHM